MAPAQPPGWARAGAAPWAPSLALALATRKQNRARARSPSTKSIRGIRGLFWPARCSARAPLKSGCHGRRRRGCAARAAAPLAADAPTPLADWPLFQLHPTDPTQATFWYTSAEQHREKARAWQRQLAAAESYTHAHTLDTHARMIFFLRCYPIVADENAVKHAHGKRQTKI